MQQRSEGTVERAKQRQVALKSNKYIQWPILKFPVMILSQLSKINDLVYRSRVEPLQPTQQATLRSKEDMSLSWLTSWPFYLPKNEIRKELLMNQLKKEHQGLGPDSRATELQKT